MMRSHYGLALALLLPFAAMGQGTTSLRVNLDFQLWAHRAQIGPPGLALTRQSSEHVRHSFELSNLQWRKREIGSTRQPSGRYETTAELWQAALAIRYQGDWLFGSNNWALRPYLGLSMRSGVDWTREVPLVSNRFDTEQVALQGILAVVPGLQWRLPLAERRLTLHLESGLPLFLAEWVHAGFDDPSLPLRQQRFTYTTWLTLPTRLAVARLGLSYQLEVN